MAKSTRKTPDVEVVEAESEDQKLVSADTDKLRSFMGGLVAFFRTATSLEKKAKEQLDIARQLKKPTNADEDAKVQVVLRDSKLARKAIDEHWSITQVVHALHRRMTAARERGGKNADDAAGIAQRLHNDYVEDARRKAREEEERVNREREEAARADRQRQLDAMENEALMRELEMENLSEREQRFVDLVWQGFNTPATAARSVGYAKPEQQGARLMESDKIKKAIAAKQDAERVRTQARAIADKPLDVRRETVAADVTKAAGTGGDSTRWSGEVIDERLFIEAVIGGRHGIPIDCLTVNQSKLTEYATSMHELIDRWPGVRAKKTTTTRVTR